MPRRPVIPGTSISPRHSSNAINEVVNNWTQKIISSTVEPPKSTSRRTSFSMENILHPMKKDKKHDEAKEREPRKDKRTSLILPKKSSKSRDRNSAASPRIGPVKAAKLELIRESPPLILIGSPTNSSGALFSGRMNLIVDDPTGSVTLTKFSMELRVDVTTRKPISKDCKDCMHKPDALKTWEFLSESKTFQKGGDNQFPFSWLFPGNLPATTTTHLGSLSYSLYATALTSTGENIEFTCPLTILRAVPKGPEKSSIRIFPPTHLTGRVTLPQVIHPIGTFPVVMTLSGVVEKRSESQTRWRLRKMMWRIEEHSKVVSTPCKKHLSKVSEGKAIQHTDTRVLGNDEMKSGWKTDFDTIGGEIALEFEASVATKPAHKVVCNMESKNGMEVKHNLVIELIVAEEFCPNKNTQLITPTGAARVLRMQFALNVTERAGMGISWDEEQPPMYEDVPPSPPGYGGDKLDSAISNAAIEEYHGPELEAVDLERVSTDNPNDPPLYRERDAASYRDVNEGLPMRLTRTNSDEVVPGSSNRRRLVGFQLDELEEETAEEAYRRQRAAEAENVATTEDFDEGLSGTAPSEQQQQRQ